MSEPSASAATAAATGLTLLGVTTGLDPAVLIAGLAGGLWAQSYQSPTDLWKRAALTVMSSVVAGYLAPAAASLAGLAGDFRLPLAVLVGLTCHRVLGPAVLRYTSRKAEEL